MKLKDFKLLEGQVEIEVLMTLNQIIENGITNTAQLLVLAKAIISIRSGFVDVVVNFPQFYNECFPNKAMLDEIRALSVEDAKALASLVGQVLAEKNEQLANVFKEAEIQKIIYYSTAANAND